MVYLFVYSMEMVITWQSSMLIFSSLYAKANQINKHLHPHDGLKTVDMCDQHAQSSPEGSKDSSILSDRKRVIQYKNPH